MIAYNPSTAGYFRAGLGVNTGDGDEKRRPCVVCVVTKAKETRLAHTYYCKYAKV